MSDGFTSEGWTQSFPYESSGFRPAIATGGSNAFLEVHQEGPSVGPLFYRVARSSGPDPLDWGPSRTYEAHGVNPAVAMGAGDTAVAVAVHQAVGGVGPLWYRVGQVYKVGPFESYLGEPGVPVADFSLAWGDSAQYDNGVNPAVAMSSYFQPTPPSGVLSGWSVVLEVHQAGLGVGPLWCRVGRVVRNPPSAVNLSITWGKSVHYDNGLSPAVAMDLWPAGQLVAVEVHQGGAEVGPLWYRVGQVDGENLSVKWGNSVRYDKGLSPALAMESTYADATSLPVAIEVHQAGAGVGSLRWASGKTSAEISPPPSDGFWTDQGEFEAQGVKPAVAYSYYGTNQPTVVAVYQEKFGFGRLLWRRMVSDKLGGGTIR
jgi:hypothetical protein